MDFVEPSDDLLIDRTDHRILSWIIHDQTSDACFPQPNVTKFFPSARRLSYVRMRVQLQITATVNLISVESTVAA
jgi:hypothetical protein